MGDVVAFSRISFLVQDPLFERPVSLDASRGEITTRDTKSVGDLSEAQVLAALVDAGYSVSRPFGENQRYDLIVDDGRHLFRVQVKTGRIRGAVIRFNCCSTHGHRRTTLVTRPYAGQIEFLAVYCPDNRKVYLVPEADVTRSKIQIRLSAPRNNMSKKIRWASKYELA